MSTLNDTLSSHKYIDIAPMEVCQGEDHLQRRFQEFLDAGGEGIILRDPNAPFQHGRSAGYLKHKVAFPYLK